jgi:hypothetical protein
VAGVQGVDVFSTLSFYLFLAPFPLKPFVFLFCRAGSPIAPTVPRPFIRGDCQLMQDAEPVEACPYRNSSDSKDLGNSP